MVNLIEILKKELENEADITRKFLKIVPVDKFDWRPHPKSMSLGQLVTHVAELPTWVGIAIHTDELDFEKADYKPKEIHSVEELEQYFEENQATAIKDLSATDEETLAKQWTMRSGENIYIVQPKGDVVRVAISQTIHHRAQLGVFLRLLDIPIPGSYGPSADESF
jgi:uncharacterized damage-inducible protein DinB